LAARQPRGRSRRGHQAAKVPRIGLLGLGSASAWAARLEPLRAWASSANSRNLLDPVPLTGTR